MYNKNIRRKIISYKVYKIQKIYGTFIIYEIRKKEINFKVNQNASNKG